MYLNKIKLFLVISICLIFFFLTYNDVKSYEIKIIDGDTIHLNSEKIRFSGIDTPELKQTCNKNNEIVLSKNVKSPLKFRRTDNNTYIDTESNLCLTNSIFSNEPFKLGINICICT